MYNQKCDSLCSIIENNKIEIENYKTIVFHAQQTMEAKDKEIEGLTSLLVQFKNKTEELEKNIQINNDKSKKRYLKKTLNEDDANYGNNYTPIEKKAKKKKNSKKDKVRF